MKNWLHNLVMLNLFQHLSRMRVKKPQTSWEIPKRVRDDTREKYVFAILQFIIIFNLVFFVWQNRQVYLEKFDIVKYEEIYKYSQYNVPQNEFRGNIGDSELFSLAGVHYLRGEDPTLINFEHQPLAKYFFGLSILLFGNATVIQLIFGLILLGLTFYSGKIIFKKNWLAAIPVLILSFDFLFKEQISGVYLDLFLAINLMIFFLLFHKSLENKKFLPWAVSWVGVIGLSKSIFTVPGVVGVIGIYLLWWRRDLIISVLKNSFWAVAVYLGGYFVYFLHHKPWDFIQLHWRDLILYKDYVPEYPKGETLRIIFLGQWRKWFGDRGLMEVNTWSVFWPIATLSLILIAFKKIPPLARLFLIWTIIWLVGISMRLVFPRHLLPVLPMMYILMIYAFKNHLWLGIILIFHIFISFLFPFIYRPEMLTYPYFLSSGWLPYRDWSMVYTPVLPYILKFIYETFGYSIFTYHWFSTLLTAGISVLVAFSVYKVQNSKFVATLVGIFASLLIFAFEGNTMWFDIFLAPVIFLIYLLEDSFLKKTDYRKIFLAGLLFGIIVLTKQTSFYILPPLFFLALFSRQLKMGEIIKIFVVFFLPVLLCLSGFLIYLSANGLVGDFYKWGIQFVFLLPFFWDSASHLAPDFLAPTLKQLLVVIAIFGLGFGVTLIKRDKYHFFAAIFLFFSMFFVFPRFGFFHLIPALILCLFLVAVRIPVLLAVIGLFSVPLFVRTFQDGDRHWNKTLVSIADEIQSNYPKATFFPLNGPDVVYVFTKKMPPIKPYLDQLPWQMEFAKTEFNNAFFRGVPDIVIFQPYAAQPTEGLGAYQPVKIVDYVMKNYTSVKSFPGGLKILVKNGYNEDIDKQK